MSDPIRKKAREIAHSHCPRCTGGERQGREGHRWHSNGCDALTEALVEAFRAFSHGHPTEAAIRIVDSICPDRNWAYRDPLVDVISAAIGLERARADALAKDLASLRKLAGQS